MLSDRELATVLAALRCWQESQAEASQDDLVERWPQFATHRPLLPIEIDALCLRLNEPCGCERSGPYWCGLPGILARLQDGQIVPASVERCDECERYPSDQAAHDYLVEVGWLPPKDTTATS